MHVPRFAPMAGLCALALSPSLIAGSLFPANPSADQVSSAKIFEEPLVALGTPGSEETLALARALDAFVNQGTLEDLGAVEAFLHAYPDTPWKVSLLVNIGLMQRHTGQISKALDSWEAAWNAGKNLSDSKGTAFVNRALGELLEANAGLGRKSRLQVLVKEAEGRNLFGLVTEKLSGARESLSYLSLSPETAYRCGPTALAFVKAEHDPLAFADPVIHKMYSTEKGSSRNCGKTSTHPISASWQHREPGQGDQRAF